MAKACVSERISYLGLTLSDAHSSQLEMILTNFVVTQMQTEGSTYYRSEAAAQGNQQVGPKGPKRKNESTKEERPKAKAKGKNKNNEQTKDDDKATAPEAGDDDNAAEDGEDALPW